jgi:hypothetical protein
VFGNADHLGTEEILERLHNLEEAPWSDLRGKPLDARSLSQRLRQYEVRSKNVRIDGKVVKGYSSADLFDPWSRYLPANASDASQDETQTDTPQRYIEEEQGTLGSPPNEPATSATSATQPCPDTGHTPKHTNGQWTCPDCQNARPARHCDGCGNELPNTTTGNRCPDGTCDPWAA